VPDDASPPDDDLLARLRGGEAPDRAERAHLGAALRRLIQAAVSTTATDAALADATAQVRHIAEQLGSTPTRWPPGNGFGAAPGGDMFVTHPLVGAANPLAPPLRVEVRDGRVVARATYGPAHEGLRGKVHGGVIAAAFDGMVIFASVVGGHRGLTGSLNLRFLRTTPIGVDITYESELERIDGRKAFVTGRLRDADGNVCVEAEGVIVSVDREVFER